MYLISVLVGRAQPLVWGLLFKDENNALAALAALSSVGDIDVQDDHGQRLRAKGGDLGPIMFEDMDKSKEANVARAVHDQKVRAAAIQRMQADPSLRTLSPMLNGGPAMLNPVGMGRG